MFSAMLRSLNSSSDWNDREIPARARRRALHRLTVVAVEGDGARPRSHEPGDGVDDGGLAGAVRSDQSVDLTGVQVDRQVIDGHDATELHRQAFDLEHAWRDALRGRLDVVAGEGVPLDGFGFGTPAAEQARHAVLDLVERVGVHRVEAVLIRAQDEQQQDATGDGQVALDVVEVAEELGADATLQQRGAEDRAADRAHAADHGHADDVDRREDGELAGEDVGVAERHQNAGQRGERRGEHERVHLGGVDVHAGRRGGPLVRSHRDEPPTSGTTADVADHERRGEEEHDDDEAVPLRVPQRADVPAEERR